MKIIQQTVYDVKCRCCNKDFERVSRSRQCKPCKIENKKAKKKIRNKQYYAEKVKHNIVKVDKK